VRVSPYDILVKEELMSFKARHKKIYFVWVIISAFVALSMVLFLVAPLLLY